MTPFLQQTARHYCSAGNSLADILFVLPGERAVAFFNKYMAEEVAASGRGPVIAPQTLSISAFFSRLSPLAKADRITCLVELYACYSALCRENGSEPGPMDDFVFWGDMILADFSDVDKYLVDAKDLFTNVADIKNLEDDLSYLSADQRRAIERFIGMFRTGGEYKDRFLRLWKVLGPLYVSFNEALAAKGLATEGGQLRGIVRSLDGVGAFPGGQLRGIAGTIASGGLATSGEEPPLATPGADPVAERLLFEAHSDAHPDAEPPLATPGADPVAERLLSEAHSGADSVAEPLLSESHPGIHAEASSVAEPLLAEAFPGIKKIVFCGLNALNDCEKKILGALRDQGLAEFCWDYQSDWIRDGANKSSKFLADNVKLFPAPKDFVLEPCTAHPDFEVISLPTGVGQTRLLSDLLRRVDIPKNERTAVVLPDEALLLPLLDAVPPEATQVNVTMGYPMGGSSFFSLMDNAGRMQMDVRISNQVPTFYHKQVWSIVGNNIFGALADERTREIVADMKKARRYRIPAASLRGTPLLDVIFRPTDGSVAQLQEYLLEVLDFIGKSIAGDEQLCEALPLELDFAMEYVKAINLLAGKKLDVRPDTWLRLLRALLQTRSIPFKGEPLTGLQVMGPLETRALDFDNLFILSCNEGVFPRRNVANSFIPHFLREAFGMPTYEFQDAVWAYYFYRMVQRPARVWLLVDTRSDGLNSGEESRYIKQLQYHFGATITRKSVVSVPRSTPRPASIPKTAAHVARMHERPLSASALKTYLACPASFYYGYVEGLRPEDDVAESLDAGMIGNVYHSAMQQLYSSCPVGRVTPEFLQDTLKDVAGIRALVEQLVREQLGSDSIHGRDIVLCSMICKYITKTLERDIEFVKTSPCGFFVEYGLEIELLMKVNGFRFKGVIDRLDSVSPSVLRVVDYKTGKVLKEDTEINDESAVKIADKIFNPQTANKDRPLIALQFYIYDRLLAKSGLAGGKTVLNSVYSTRELLSTPPVNVPSNALFIKAMDERLAILLSEMENTDIPFSRTEDSKTCEYCEFKTICGR